MFKLLKFIIALIVLAGLAYFTFFVTLGEHTLWDHLVGISETNEAKELGNQLEKKAENIKQEVIENIPKMVDKKGAASHDKTAVDSGTSKDTEGSAVEKKELKAPLSELSQEDREALIQLLQEKKGRQ